MLRFAFVLLRWPPDIVWRATPREIAAALGRGGPEPLRAADLGELMLAFPDLPPAETPDDH